MKQFLIFASIVAILALGVWGSVLPYRKAGLYAVVSNRVSQGVTLEQFKDLSSFMIDAPSPIGKDEGVKMLVSQTINAIMQTENIPRDVIDDLLRFSEQYFVPIFEKGVSGNFAQNFVLVGAMYQSAGLATGDRSYFEEAKNYYEEGLIYSPNRPQLLYGLFDVYVALGDSASAKKTGEQILTLWPEDAVMKERLKELQMNLQ